MFEGWENYYLMLGPSAAALIGLMFVVVTLTAGRDHDEVERGKHLYTSPIVWHLAVVMVLSGAALAPHITARAFSLGSGALAVAGIGIGVRNAVAIVRARLAPAATGFDMVWYGIAPAVAYAGLGGAALAVADGSRWGASAVAAALMALLLVSIHAEWDLVTFLAPMAEPPSKAKRK
jgi:hypothetical protein